MQTRLLALAAIFLLLYSTILTLAPAVRLHTWQVEYRWQHWLGFTAWLAGFILLSRQIQRLLPDADPYLLPVAALLSGWGLLTIWRLDETLGLRQTAWLALSLLAFWGIARLPRVLHTLRRYKYLWLTGGLLLTALTFIFGTYPGGSGPRLWLDFGGIYLQPSEPLKLMLIAFLAAYLADNLPVNLNLLHLLLPSLVVSGAALVILVAQRDLGTATLFMVLYAVMIFQATGKRRVIAISALLVLTAGILGYQVFDVIKVRVDAWLNPWLDSSGRSYQIVQSLLAVAAGGLGGTGVGMGSPGIVPVVSSDFIFAAISEESGILGALALIVLFSFIAGRGLLNALRAPNTYQRLLAAGLVVYLVFQGMLIIGGNLRVFPLTGVTLPFVSYGGSSLVTSFISLALLVRISSQGEEEPAPLPNTRPILLTGAGLLSGLLLMALASGYWAIIRGEDLLQRADNPRWSIAERYVQRGAILDRNNQPIVQTVGEPGSYARQVLHADLGSTIGYTHPVYGKAGLELSLDSYLRGALGNPSSAIVSSNLLYAQPPTGVDVRLSLDLRIQAKADALLQGKSGALVLLNAHSGEILAISSHPTFNPNLLDEKWAEWVQDQRGIFLNRATQGQYPPGGVIGPFLLSETLTTGYLPPPVFASSAQFEGLTWNCALSTASTADWATAIQNGCPGARLALGQQFSASQLIQLYQRLGLTETPAIPLPVNQSGSLSPGEQVEGLALGQTGLLVSPLQVALAATMLSGNGIRPSPRISSAVRTPLQGWVILSADSAGQPGASINASKSTAQHLQNSGLPIWQSTATARSTQGEISWFIAGTLPEKQLTPLALALVLEDGSPSQAQSIGRELLQFILLP